MNKQTLILTKPLETFEVDHDIEFNFLYIGKGAESLKSKLIINHKKPGLKSRINIKAVVFDKSRFDLEAILKIEKGAVGTDTYLKIDCLVIGDNAYARAIPSLEINESEVKGGHGATIGYIDPVQMHYISSRGLNKKQSEDLLIEGFINS